MGVENLEEGVVVGEAERTREFSAYLGIDRQRVGLRIVQVLQAMLDLAQEEIRGVQPLAQLRGNQPDTRRMREHGKGWTRAESRVLAAADQLENLGAEFQLADAAATQLDVVALIGPAARPGAEPPDGSAPCNERIAPMAPKSR